jgi:hypothetical protein
MAEINVTEDAIKTPHMPESRLSIEWFPSGTW